MTIKLTDKRKKILVLLQREKGALSASAVHKMLPDIDLVTIYRNLDAFAKEKLIRRVSLGTDEALYEYQPEPHHHAICSDCEKVIHFKAPDAKIIKLLGLEAFDIDELEVTVRGKCKAK
ncbi:MAG: transcriptional repressor [Candidatus Pacebacteria bacterium]|nr:transcriptional repressor [Candidatus Paceibacterota bacterium]